MCQCANCQDKITYTTIEVGDWPGYQYGGVNSFHIDVEKNVICIGKAELVLTFNQRLRLFNLTLISLQNQGQLPIILRTRRNTTIPPMTSMFSRSCCS